MDKLFFFKVGDAPAIADIINVEGLVSDDCINEFHIDLQAKKYANFLSNMTGRPCKYYEKGKEQNAITINNQ